MKKTIEFSAMEAGFFPNVIIKEHAGTVCRKRRVQSYSHFPRVSRREDDREKTFI
jgi:hypothetical protein